MTDEESPDSASRRARLATRRHRLRIVGAAVATIVVVASVTTAFALHNSDAGPLPVAGKKHTAKESNSSTTLNLGLASKLDPPRPLSHADPLKLWVGGDSLAGSFGPALGQMASATGVVDATIDYKVSSGLADNGVRDWYEHAQEAMASENPDAVVFIIGTNDASIVNNYDSNNDGVPDWEAGYREKVDRMMETFVGGSRHRTVFWLGPPTLGDSTLDKGAKALGPLMRQEAAKFAPDVVYVDTYHLFSGPDGGYSRSLPDKDGNDVEMRISDGIHFTVDGARIPLRRGVEAAQQALAHHAAGRPEPAHRLHHRTRQQRLRARCRPLPADDEHVVVELALDHDHAVDVVRVVEVGHDDREHPDHRGHRHDNRPFDDTDHRAAHDDAVDHAAHHTDDGAASAGDEQTGRLATPSEMVGSPGVS